MYLGGDMPYFMKNEDWYYFDDKEEIYKPTMNAPEKAVRSIDRFNKEHTGYDENGNRWSDY